VPAGSVDIRIDDDSNDELRSLAGWLRDEDDFRGRIRFVEKAVDPGQMGGFVDAAVVVLTSGTASTFVSSLFGWFARRKETHAVSLKLRAADGRELELKCGSGDDAQRVLDQVLSVFSDEA
jgi:hypothetical protein